MEMRIRINGMSCSHCQARVEKGLSELDGVTSVRVDLPTGTATVVGDASAPPSTTSVTNTAASSDPSPHRNERLVPPRGLFFGTSLPDYSNGYIFAVQNIRRIHYI